MLAVKFDATIISVFPWCMTLMHVALVGRGIIKCEDVCFLNLF